MIKKLLPIVLLASIAAPVQASERGNYTRLRMYEDYMCDTKVRVDALTNDFDKKVTDCINAKRYVNLVNSISNTFNNLVDREYAKEYYDVKTCSERPEIGYCSR